MNRSIASGQWLLFCLPSYHQPAATAEFLSFSWTCPPSPVWGREMLTHPASQPRALYFYRPDPKLQLVYHHGTTTDYAVDAHAAIVTSSKRSVLPCRSALHFSPASAVSRGPFAHFCAVSSCASVFDNSCGETVLLQLGLDSTANKAFLL
ncbi:uncharacterized protein BDV14DRAFT_108074 [Aspergillus stella-maris]|uniref:uncharacterized protein n=1 Tax=Aspergillus stella-maris TaxID=1810926 RepID=UPI003CCE41C2